MVEFEHGWTLMEALERCQDRSIRRQFDQAKADLQTPTGAMITPKGRRTHNFVTGEVYYPALRPQMNKDLLPQLERQLLLGFRQSLVSGELVTFARKNSAAAEYSKIPASAWKKLKFANFKNSTAHESYPEQPKIRYHEIRVFPPLRTPDAVEQVILISDPGQLFRKLVLRDAEFKAAIDAIRETNNTRHSTLSSGYFGQHDGQCWPVGTNEARSTWCWRIQSESNESTETEHPIGILNPDSGIPPFDAVDILFDRHNCLWSMLRSAKIEAWGQNKRSGQIELIPRTWWDHRDNWFCFEHNLLCKKNKNGKFKTLFGGVYFRRPAMRQTVAAGTTADIGAPTTSMKNLGGRPPKYDWDAATRELMRIANSPNGLPPTQVKRINHLQNWFQDQFNAEPAESSIKEFLKRVCHLDQKDE